MKKTILNVEHLNVFYKETENNFRKTTKRQVLQDISFTMEEGEILGLVGESGSGKSTLVKTILNMVKDYDGKIECKAQNPQMVFQDPYASLNPTKKVGWILKEPLRMQGKYTKQQMDEKVYTMLEKVGLPKSIAEHYPSEMSGGQRQRVCIGTALMLAPKLLIADEPVSALDVTIQAPILELLLTLQKEMGMAILFISHDLRIIAKMCKRVMVLKDGQLVEKGLVKDIYQNPQADYTKQLLNFV